MLLGEHVRTDRDDLEPVGAGVADHVLDQARAAPVPRMLAGVSA
jgi:hypothetical protein